MFKYNIRTFKFDLNDLFNYYFEEKNEIYLDYIKNINSENILPGILKTLLFKRKTLAGLELVQLVKCKIYY